MKPSSVTAFRGLNNTSDPLTLGLGWLVTAENIDITDRGRIQVRPGYGAPIAATNPQAYGTIDHQRAYYTDGDALKTIEGVTIATGLSSGPISWAEVDRQVFYCNGVDTGIIGPDHTVRALSWPIPATPSLAAVAGNLDPGLYRVCCTFELPDGRETGASDPAEIEIQAGQGLQVSGIAQTEGMRTRTYICPANSTVFQRAYSGEASAFVWNTSPDYLGSDLTTDGLDPIPAGASIIQHWNGRLHAAVYEPQADATFIFQSEALAYHLFDLEKSIAVDGQARMLAPSSEALVIGTDKAIYAYDRSGALLMLANYGVTPGWPWWIDDSHPSKTLYIWTERGMCRFPEFANLAGDQVSVAPGVHAGAAVVQANGQKRFVVALHQGGIPFNSRS